MTVITIRQTGDWEANPNATVSFDDAAQPPCDDPRSLCRGGRVAVRPEDIKKDERLDLPSVGHGGSGAAPAGAGVFSERLRFRLNFKMNMEWGDHITQSCPPAPGQRRQRGLPAAAAKILGLSPAEVTEMWQPAGDGGRGS